jgi:WD repeat-containing protein 21A
LHQETNYQKRTKLKALKLVYSRELNGNVISVNKKMSNFRDEIQKTQASYPVVWRYGSTEDIGDTALKQFQVDVQTPVGLTRKNILVAGSAGGCLSILRVSKDRQVYDGVIECDPVSVLPCKENDTEEREAPEHILRPTQPCLVALSSISSIELIGRSDASENSHPVNRALYPLNVSYLLLSVLISHL